jgi:hypothetical protein
MTLPFSAEALLDAIDGIACVVDGEGLILGFSRGPSLAAGGSGSLGPWDSGRTIGKNLFSMMRGTEVRESYQTLHRAVWSGDRLGVGFEYRCDTPETERRMRMSLSLIRDNATPVAVLCQSTILSETPRVPLPLFAADLLAAPGPGNVNDRIVTVCAYCQNVAWPVGPATEGRTWIDAAEFYRRDSCVGIAVSHGVCEPCLDRVKTMAMRKASRNANR